MIKRGFELSDIFTMSEIIDKMGVELDLNTLLDKSKDLKDNKQSQAFVGGQIALLFIKKFHKAKDEIIEFISQLSGDPVEVVEKYKPKQIKEFFMELFGNEEFMDFFK